MIWYSGQCLNRTFALIVLVFLVALGGCGFKDKPVPPSRVVPQVVTDLRYQLGENGAILNWTYPRKTVSGDVITEIASFVLYRADVPVESYCKTCPIPFTEPIPLPGGALPPGGAKTATYAASGLRPGTLYFFKIRSKTGWWTESQDSNVVSFLWQVPPMVPEGLTALSGDGRNTLKWQPATRLQDGTPMIAAVRYQIYRGAGDGAPVAIAAPVATAAYIDTGLENGKTYAYQVQAINTYEQGTVSGGLSAPVTATPVDRTAPPVPQGVQDIRTDVGIKIFWEHVEAADLAGYRVYRRVEGENKTTLVGEVKLPYNLFIDTKAPPKAVLFYSVSSIDTQEPANESAKSSEVKVVD